MTSENEEKPGSKSHGRRHRENGFEEWGGYMASKKMKLAAQFDAHRKIETEDQDKVETDIFKGVSIYVNGYTKPTAEELKRLMMIHGGKYHHYYSTTKTSHIVASNLPDSKIKKLKNEIVVKPDWITESIKAGKLLPHQDYLLYTPEFTHQQQRLRFENFTDSKAIQSAILITQEFDSKLSAGASLFNSSNQECPLNDNSGGTENFQSNYMNHKISPPSGNVAGNSTVISPSKRENPIVAGQPSFLSEFYSHSRLHHISTAGQELKRYVQTLVDNHNSKTFPGRERIKELIRSKSIPLMEKEIDIMAKNDGNKKNQHVIMHLDMDCFFVSVGLRKHPELIGKPVAVTHSKGKKGGAQDGSDIQFEVAHYQNQSKKKIQVVTSFEQGSFDGELLDKELKEKPKISKHPKEYGSMSEIACCSYEARSAGIRNGMYLGEALRRCPNLKTIPYDFDGYSEVSKQLYDIVSSYTLDIEAVSVDELYVDCAEILQDTRLMPLQLASILRSEIAQKTGCTASAGLGFNMLLARLANRVAKPNGQYFVSPERTDEFIFKQKVKDLPGVGYTTSAKFENLGVISCGDMQSWSLAKLQQEFGPKTGQTLYNRCRGIDDRVVQLQKERKSVSAEINYGIRFEKEEDIYNFLKELSSEVVNRLNNINCKGKSVTLKLMIRHPDAPVQSVKFLGHGVCEHISKSVTLKSATDDPAVIGSECCTLARSFKIKPEDYRGVGIQLSRLESKQKDTKGYKSIENFLCFNVSSNESEGDLRKEIFVPKELEPAKKSIPAEGTIRHFLSNKTSPTKQKSYQPQTLSLQELDQSVLNALPEDLQKEVLEMYSSRPADKPTNSLSHSNTSNHSVKPATILQQKKAHSSHAKSSKSSTKQNTLIKCIESFKSQCNNYEEDSVLRKKAATIGGAEDINEVRSLVKEWVLSSQVVLDEDIDQFRDYILEVIDEDLKKVDLILKYFHRVVSTANSMWQQAYLTVLSYVQQKVLQKFGTMLDARSEFPTQL